MKFKQSTHTAIDQRVKELFYPEVEAGKTYYFREYKDGELVERPVVKVTKDTVTYLRLGKVTTAGLNAFRRMLSIHGVEVTNETP